MFTDRHWLTKNTSSTLRSGQIVAKTIYVRLLSFNK